MRTNGAAPPTRVGRTATLASFALGFGGALCLVPLVFIRRWDETARASST